MERMIFLMNFSSKSFVRVIILGILFSSSYLFSQSTTTNLKDPKQISIFLEVTSKIRCICLPSLPIQSCSFNMCTASAYLKNFIENRIKDGMSADDIIYKMEHGFGDDILGDPVVLHFKNDGNSGMVDSIVYGFGEKILAKPDSSWINGTLFLFGILGLIGIFLYMKKNRKTIVSPLTASKKADVSEIQKRIKDWENQI